MAWTTEDIEAFEKTTAIWNPKATRPYGCDLHTDADCGCLDHLEEESWEEGEDTTVVPNTSMRELVGA